MSTIQNLSACVALAAFALSLPVAAEEHVTTQIQERTGLQPVSTQRLMPVRAGESPHPKEIEAALPATPTNETMPNPDNMPYITYDGAANSGQ